MNKQITVRSICSDDLHMLLTWRNSPFVRDFMLTRHLISESEHYEWFLTKNKDSLCTRLIVEENERPLGYVQFDEIYEGGEAVWTFHLRPDAPRGSGTKLGLHALNYAFDVLRFRAIHGKVLDFNNKSISFHYKMGFIKKTVLQNQLTIDKNPISLICFKLEKKAWQKTCVR